MKTLFDHLSYRDYLKIRLGDGLRLGLKKQAAVALGVHTTLISQILSGKCEISLEQGEDMNRFLGHSEDEADYFINLVLRERAGTGSLRKRFDKQIASLQEKRLNLSERVKDRTKISEGDKDIFYSSYLYGAVHVLSAIPDLKTRPALAGALGVSLSKVSEIVEFLLRINVLKEEGGLLSPGSQHIHLNSKSKQIVRHHLNWRLKAMEVIGESPGKDLHYSVVYSLSEADASRIKAMLLKAMEEVSAVVTPSPEETAFVYCFDFFELRK